MVLMAQSIQVLQHAIQAGVYNFTYFPISTGIRQENAPLTKRMVSVPTESAPNNNSYFLSMGNQSG